MMTRAILMDMVPSTMMNSQAMMPTTKRTWTITTMPMVLHTHEDPRASLVMRGTKMPTICTTILTEI